MALQSFFQQSENSEINVSVEIFGCKTCQMVEKGEQNLVIRDVMNNHVLTKTGGKKFLKKF